MPTIAKRMVVTPTPKTASQLAVLSQLTGKSVTRIARDWMHESAPVFDAMIRALIDLNKATDRQTAERVTSGFVAEMAPAIDAAADIFRQGNLSLRRKPGRKPKQPATPNPAGGRRKTPSALSNDSRVRS